LLAISTYTIMVWLVVSMVSHLYKYHHGLFGC